MIAEGLKEWLEECPYIQVLDMSQVKRDGAGLYKQASNTVTLLADGSEIHSDNWYILVQRSSQLPSERMDTHEVMENFEDWVYQQKINGIFPEIGHLVCEVDISNGYFLFDEEHDEAVYQSTIRIEYLKEPKEEY